MGKIIYDFGSHKGEDIEYYLKKSDLVVAVEANTELVRIIEERYKKEILEKRLVVINCVLTREIHSSAVEFYIFQNDTLVSQHTKPNLSKQAWENYRVRKVFLPSRRASDIIREYGEPHYIKIDLEGYDAEVLKDIFNENIFPEYISAESHTIDTFATLVCLGNYDSYALVDGPSTQNLKNILIRNIDGEAERYSFNIFQSGPFGKDLQAKWFDKSEFLKHLSDAGLGWKDIHARKEKSPT